MLALIILLTLAFGRIVSNVCSREESIYVDETKSSILRSALLP